MNAPQLILGKDGAWPVLGCPNCPFAHASAIRNNSVRFDCILGERFHLGAVRPDVAPERCPLRDRSVEVFLPVKS